VTLDEDGGHHVVAGAQVGEQLVEQVAMIGPIPEVMVRVDDRQVGIEDGLGRRLPEPRLARCGDATEACRRRRQGYLPSSAASGA
jgi:hypothetical protein